VEKGDGRETISNFVSAGIQRIIFERGTQGCFGGHKETQYYDLQNNQFILVIARNNAQDSTLHYYPDSIDQRSVEEFAKLLPAIYAKRISIDELQFSKNEYETCKRNILKLRSFYEGEPKEEENPFAFDGNPDFTMLVSLVDSVKTIHQELLNGYFLSQRNLSTLHYWTKITFVNKKGEELEIKNEEYCNGLYFPWQVKLNGLYSVTTATEISRFLNTVYPNFLDNGSRKIGFLGNGNRKVNVIQELVKLLYRRAEYTW